MIIGALVFWRLNFAKVWFMMSLWVWETIKFAERIFASFEVPSSGIRTPSFAAPGSKFNCYSLIAALEFYWGGILTSLGL